MIMLSLMRKKAGSWFIKVILGAIVIVFIFWGVGSYRSQKLITVATVNGSPVTVEEYRKNYNNLLERYRRQFGGNLDENMLKMLNLSKQALDQLIDQELLRQEAKRLNFRVTQTELIESIKVIPAFQSEDGRFDNTLYNRVLDLNRFTTEDFEALQKDSLLLEKVRSFVVDNVKISEPEAREWYLWENTEVDMTYIHFNPETYQTIEVTDDEIKSYFDAHRGSYKTEARIKAQYVVFDPQKYGEKVSVSEDDIPNYYETHLDEYEDPKTVEARHILLKLDAKASPEVVEMKKGKANEILKTAREGKDFAELAKTYSEDNSKDTGGYLGTFKKEEMVKPFADKAFSMNAGDISEPVRTQFGWHIIKVEKVNEASRKPLDAVKEQIQKKLIEEYAKNMARDDAETFFDAVFEGDDLKKVAEAQKVDIHETDLFTQKGPEGMKNAVQFANAAFKLSPMEISDIQEYNDGYYLIQAIEEKKAEESPIEDVAQAVKQDLIAEKRDAKAKTEAEACLAALKEGKSLEEIGKNLNNAPKITGFFKRNDPIPEIGPEQEMTKAAFMLTPENQWPPSPLKGRKGYYVIQFKERKLPNPEGFEKEKETITQRLLRQKQFQAFDKWLAQLKEKSQIVIQEDMMN
jgi:peptidyl-prolyl cis-trans isomerase D